MCGPVVPSVPSSVLNHAITCFEKNLSSVIQFEIHFTKNNNVEVHRVGSVHPRMIQFQDINHPRQLLLNFFESRRCSDRIDAGSCIRRYGEETEAETILWGEIASLRWRRPVRRKFRDGIASPEAMKLVPRK